MDNVTIKKRIIYIPEKEYEKLLSELECIELYDDEIIDMSIDECRKYENKRNIEDVVSMYIWFTVKNRIDSVSSDTYAHIERFLRRHLKVIKDEVVEEICESELTETEVCV